jgi:hypothetical protein
MNADERAYECREKGKLLRTMRNKWMSTFRSVPRVRRAQHVVLTAWQIDPDADFVLATLPHDEREFWVRGRRLARELVATDHRAGGEGFFVQYEYRRCLICRRLLIGGEASAYRERCRWPKKTWQYKQGPVCGPTCAPKLDGRKMRGHQNARK